MKKKLAWVCLLVSPLVLGGSAFFLLHSKKATEPPLEVSVKTLIQDYLQDEAKADLKYKGKYLYFEFGDRGGSPEEDSNGKYIPYFWGSKEVRCYFDGPIQGSGGERFDADGVCGGLKKGKAYGSGGNDW